MGADSPYLKSGQMSPVQSNSPGREQAMKELALKIPQLKALTNYKNNGQERSDLKQIRDVHQLLKKGQMSIIEDKTERRVLAAVVQP